MMLGIEVQILWLVQIKLSRTPGKGLAEKVRILFFGEKVFFGFKGLSGSDRP